MDFADPSRAFEPPAPYVLCSARISSGSPARVPVPCPSSIPTSAGSTPDAAMVAATSLACARPRGTRMGLPPPLWLVRTAMMRPYTRCPRARARDSRSSTTIPTASPQSVPLASSE
ncbi:Uncharacterised protein [Mycobacteroides abscessus subsp. abscessus]|nr:Uncharacterised protein [Mycobacteroides abscessus subsp. abscessus]